MAGVVLVLARGCRPKPDQSVIALLGQAVDAADLANRKRELLGKAPGAADQTLGRLFDALTDRRADRGEPHLIVHNRRTERIQRVHSARQGLRAAQYRKCVLDEA